MIENIIWDWNGTLLNDAEYCVDCMNKVLAIHGIEKISLDIYKDKFTFPVKDYYSNIGFDFSKIDFKIPAMEFIEEYYSNIDKVKLHAGVISILDFFNEKGISQYCLSAMEHEKLISLLREKQINNYFKGTRGINDHYANSKVKMGHMLLNEYNVNNENSVMIGDTIHDYEVAQQLRIECILVLGGHQSISRLRSVSNNIVELQNLPEILTN